MQYECEADAGTRSENRFQEGESSKGLFDCESQPARQVTLQRLAVDSKKMSQERFLVFGRTGWLGGILNKLLTEGKEEFRFSDCRLEDRAGIQAEIKAYKPTHVLNAAGVTGRPNVDWCESNKVETIRTNVIGVLTLADLCETHDVHLTNFATGCIYEYDETHPEGSGKGFLEGDVPNFHGSFYSHTKVLMEDLLSSYKNLLQLRVRMPISEDLEFPRNFIYKIAHYKKVVNIPNSMTVLPELMPISLRMAKRRLTGVYNFTNPGVVSHNECLELYKQYYQPDFTWQNFTLEEQANVIVAARSNNELDASKLKKEFPEMLDVKQSLIKYVFEPNQKQK